jgi:hypothetical protein
MTCDVFQACSVEIKPFMDSCMHLISWHNDLQNAIIQKVFIGTKICTILLNGLNSLVNKMEVPLLSRVFYTVGKSSKHV